MYQIYTKKLQTREYKIELRLNGDLINYIITYDTQLYNDCLIYQNNELCCEHKLEMFDTYEELINYIIKL